MNIVYITLARVTIRKKTAIVNKVNFRKKVFKIKGKQNGEKINVRGTMQA